MLIQQTTVNAQVIIKEKVEINPKSNIVPEYPVAAFTPCGPWITSYDKNNPWQVVWNQISFAPDPYQQLFNFQDNRYGPGLQRREYTLDPNKYYNITLIQSDEYGYFTYGGFYDNTTGTWVPIQYVGTSLTGVLGSDIGATAWFDYVIDPPNGLYHSDSKYTMRIKRDIPPGTKIIMSVFDGQETINYHTRVETPTFTIQNDTPEEDTLLHNQSKEIDFYLNFQNNCQLDQYGGAYPTGIKFNVEIVQGQQYGNLYYPGTVANPDQSGISITNLDDEYGIGVTNYTIRYTADGVQPDTSTAGIVTIRCSSNDLDILPAEVSFPVKYSLEPPPAIGGYILVDFNQDSFSPGDTATTNCKWLTSYNEIIDFPGEQSFNAEIVSGKEYGMLLDPNTGTVADNLQGVSNGFKVLTPTSIPNDSVVIRIRVNTMAGDGGIIAAKIVNSQNQNSGKKQSKETDIDKSIQSMSSTLSIGNPGAMLIEGYGDVVVTQNECDEEIVICDNAQPQTFNPLWIEKYNNYSYFDPDPNDPNSLQYIVTGCQLKRNNDVQGVTFIMPGMPMGKSWNQDYAWRADRDAIIRICLLEGENRWLIRFDDLRIPIFSSDCITGLIDLGDGLNISLLELNITSMKDYKIFIDNINSWRTDYPVKANKYAFKSGIIKHEYKHFLIDSVNVINSFNNLFNTIFNHDDWFLDKNTYTCPKAVLSAKEFELRDNILKVVNNCFLRFTNISKIGKDQEELDCVKFAQVEYDLIKTRINQWAVNQDWFKP